MALTKANTKYGVAVGVPGDAAGITVFRGIPYAKPPVGALRLAEPREPEPWEGERLCDAWPKACIQFHPRPMNANRQNSPRREPPKPDSGEDCLYLNVWTPAASVGDKLLVMVWIYGGGFSNGWGADLRFRGEALAQQGVVLVTVNYRCGALGFAALPELTARSSQGVSGNYGLLDQLMALRWVGENIGAFGGDAGRITIFGQSAGGMSCKFLACSPLGRGLFQRAVIQSGGGLIGADPVRPREELEALTRQCLDSLGWTLEDLMTRDAQEVNDGLCNAGREILQGREVGLFQPCIDGYVLPEMPEKVIVDGGLADIDLICGSVTGDNWMFSRKVREQIGDNAELDRAFAYAPGIGWGRFQVKSGRKPLRTYFFERDQGDGKTPHSSEICYIFGTLDAREGPRTEYDRALSRTMTAYWANFAKTGDPNGEGLPDWPLYTAETPVALHFTDDGCRAEDIVDGPDAERLMEYTQGPHGLLQTLDGF